MTSKCDQQYHSRGDNSTRLGYCTTCATCTSKLAVNSLPFSNLNDNDFDNTINLRFNLQDNFLTTLENFKFNPFSLDKGNDTHADQNTDLDNNDLFRQINTDNCQYYTEERFNDLILQNNNHSQFSLLHFNIRSIRNKHEDLCNYLDSLNMTFSIIGLAETWLTDKYPPIYDIPAQSKGPLGCIVLHFFQHAMRLAQTILTVLLSRYQNTFQKLKIRIPREKRLFHFNRNNVN